MLDAFASVGAESVDATWTTRQAEKIKFQKRQPHGKFRAEIPARLERATTPGYSPIVRPLSHRAVFIRLDDLNRAAMERVKPAAFLRVETSSGNYQA